MKAFLEVVKFSATEVITASGLGCPSDPSKPVDACEDGE